MRFTPAFSVILWEVTSFLCVLCGQNVDLELLETMVTSQSAANKEESGDQRQGESFSSDTD